MMRFKLLRNIAILLFSGALLGCVKSEVESRVNEFGDRDSLIIVYCRSGHRSAVVKDKLIELGFTNVLNGGTKRHMEKLVPKVD